MPSLHVGWALWCGWQLVRHGQHRVTGWLGVAYPIVLSVVVMATANHYLLDVVAGFAVVGVGAVVGKLIPLGSRSSPAAPRAGRDRGADAARRSAPA